MKKDYTVTVVANVSVAPGFYRMVLTCPGVAFKPGQFFQIAVPGHTLRRPFAAGSCDAEGFSFVYQLVGEGTRALAELKKGAQTRVLAPLGNGYTLPRKGVAAVLVGGGCGTPSLVILAAALRARGNAVHSVIGARSACSLLEAANLRKLSDSLTLATDDGSKGFHGNAVEAVMDKVLPAVDKNSPGNRVEFFACGPLPMLKGLSALADDLGIACQVSLEERMACGFGACMGCAVAVKADNADGFVYKRVCHDGPVFNALDLCW